MSTCVVRTGERERISGDRRARDSDSARPRTHVVRRTRVCPGRGEGGHRRSLGLSPFKVVSDPGLGRASSHALVRPFHVSREPSLLDEDRQEQEQEPTMSSRWIPRGERQLHSLLGSTVTIDGQTDITGRFARWLTGWLPSNSVSRNVVLNLLADHCVRPAARTRARGDVHGIPRARFFFSVLFFLSALLLC